MKKGKEQDAEKGTVVVEYGAARVLLMLRGDGRVALRWREEGRTRTSTRKSMEDAKAWASRKVRELDSATGRRWVDPAAAERVAALDDLAGGGPAASRLLDTLRWVRERMDFSQLGDAVDFYLKGRDASLVKSISLGEAVELYVAECARHHSVASLRSARTELRSLSRKHGEMALVEVSHELLERHVARAHPSKRTRRNRISYWSMFFRRMDELEYWPEGRKLPSKKLRRPRRETVPVPIFSVDEGKKLLEVVAEQMPQHLSYLAVAGWLGCRPSECLRLKWEDFDFDQGLLHVVARKVAHERWVPLETWMVPFFQELRRRALAARPHHRLDPKLVCRRKAVAEISLAARKAGLNWPNDVLRHSRITYRLQVLGGNHDQVAEESANSPAIIRSNYKRPIPPGQGEAWFALLEEFAARWL